MAGLEMQNLNKWILAASLVLNQLLNADTEHISQSSAPLLAPLDRPPPFQGALLAPVGTVVPYGKFLLKSYLRFMANTGFYNENWQPVPAEDPLYAIDAQLFCFFGMTPWCDLNIIPQLYYKTTSHQHYVNAGDLTVGLDFQLMEPGATPYFPGIKLAIREIFPTGHFQDFSPKKLFADQTGMGTFGTQFDLVLYKAFHLYRLCWLTTTWSTQYTVYTPVNVHGFNSYGGGFGAKGTALPGNQFETVLSFEISLNRHWMLAIDNIYTHTNKTEFFGSPGITFAGQFAKPGKPSAEQVSFAPAIEYVPSEHFGIVAGCWICGPSRNSTQFQGGILNFQYTY